MAERIERELEFTDPYKQVRLLLKEGRLFYGRWKPFDVKIDGDEEEYVVVEGQEGQLEILSDEVYGDRQLWRIIAHANQIDFAIEEVTTGRKLIIPKLGNVYAALLATVARGASVNLDRVEA